MTYTDTAALAGNSDFTARLTACCTEQAGIFVQDARPEYSDLAREIITDPGASFWFVWLVASSPGFGDAYAGGGQAAIDDGMLLSSVQANWPIVSAAHPPEVAA
jgi:hypothetical protein